MLKCQKKWLELFLKKFLLCTFRNNVESETVLYLTNGRKELSLSDCKLASNENQNDYSSSSLFLRAINANPLRAPRSPSAPRLA